jgi:hypothetical protein
LFSARIQGLFGSGYGFFSFGFLGQFCMWVSSAHKGRSIMVTFKNYLNTCNLNFGSFWWLLLLTFSVLTCESDSCILQFLNKLNLTYQRLIGFVASFYSFQYCWCLGAGFHCVPLLSDVFRLSRIRSQSWLWVAWPRDHEVRITEFAS